MFHHTRLPCLALDMIAGKYKDKDQKFKLFKKCAGGKERKSGWILSHPYVFKGNDQSKKRNEILVNADVKNSMSLS